MKLRFKVTPPQRFVRSRLPAGTSMLRPVDFFLMNLQTLAANRGDEPAIKES